ncbi:MAG: hypothetical protein A2358_04560 [Candidatus Staskawiczbacteria bacterium RIFOXYB1_FULL_37_44]|uniref:Uncharacterized protein n=1 Tax=Candidatus Staskawiczbacteria bacterium RIFOXYB1_FULL_37_44 TaxID=1802223 RepID=A0A1G2IXB2_9BACT|nr:MAG: hypothetical protein A2358_04560 [Candidatus Staskawiczbacteria bacterium RIFOXYB1_FULL_37_44]OGZ83979.1 MAG: hypothetical protein A2416_04390 [Candidatus Staskawiczbacteria bacterium RIFOXYC1_FULL_37_52]OGZ88224.1 MAG: hypothetical protein A2444_02745 [Candidatus Staskawiczbacteria bacterium RIFOXYC2_FULL_37_19]OGZ89549.1 MAG: hypothetical protein A2581_03770 [Candidatus Staskawiczbacteria bacterium RIFOXYD1_FULL_37_110]
MEKTIDTQVELSITELLEAIEKDPSRMEPSEKKRSAMEAIKAVQAAAGKIAEHAEYLLAVVLPLVFEFLAETEKIEAGLDNPSDIPELTWADVISRFKLGIAKLMENSAFALRRAAHLANIRFKMKREINEQEAVDILVWAAQEKYLSPTFQVTAEGFGLKPEDKTEILQLVGRLRGEQLHAVETRSAEKLATVTAPPKPRTSDEEIIPQEAWAGKLGKFQLGIDNKATFELESQLNGIDKQVLIVTGITGHKNGLAELGNATILLSAIKADDGKVCDGLRIIPPPQLSGEKLENWQRKTEQLGAALKRGFSAIFEKENRELEPWEFLKGAVGMATLICEEEFKWAPPNNPDEGVTIKNLTLRFARRSDGHIGLVEVVSKSPKAAKLYDKAVGQFHNPGEAFLDMKPVQCKNFLRTVFRMVRAKQEKNKTRG